MLVICFTEIAQKIQVFKALIQSKFIIYCQSKINLNFN
jgi:hypothetical protein